MIDVVIPTRSLERAQKAVTSVRAYANSIVIVMRPEWGYTQAVEDGWRGCRSEFILFLNDDCEINRDALGMMLAAMNDPQAGIVGPTLKCRDFQNSQTNAPMRDGEYPLALTVRHLIGACLLVRRTVLEELNGWDTRFALHCSDLDLCIRAQDAGYKVIWAVQAKVEHTSSATLDEMPVDLRRQVVLQDHWKFAGKYPNERLTRHGIQVQMAIPSGNQAIYPPKAMTPTPIGA